MSNYVLPFPKSKIPKGGEFGNTILFDGTPRTNPHRGVDFSLPGGTPIPSFTTGEVVLVKWSDVLGHVAVVKDLKGGFWGYCHLRQACILAVGTKVVAGKTIIGLVGNTGSASHGAHLHLSFGPDDQSVFFGKVSDPIVAIDIRIARDAKEAPVAPVSKVAPVAAKPVAEVAEDVTPAKASVRPAAKKAE